MTGRFYRVGCSPEWGKAGGDDRALDEEQYSRGKPLRGGQAGRDWEDDGERMSSERADTRGIMLSKK